MTRALVIAVVALMHGLGALAQSAALNDQATIPHRKFFTNGPAVYSSSVSLVTNIVPAPAVARRPPSTNLPPEIRRTLIMFNPYTLTRVDTIESGTFVHFLPDSLNNLVWTNLIAHTNNRSTLIWSVRLHSPHWPTNPPVVAWNTNCLMWGMKGLTALSPCWELEASSGQVPITALTRRHGYTRGHGMGADGFRKYYAGRKVWFVTTNNQVIQMTVEREVVRTFPVTRREDYSILLFTRDLPDTIQPMRVVGTGLVPGQKFAKYAFCPNAPAPLFLTEQLGNVSADIPGFIVPAWKGGDSGSPNMLPMPGELIFMSGRSTTGPTPEMQHDMDELCRQSGLDPRKYQMQWLDLSTFPSY